MSQPILIEPFVTGERSPEVSWGRLPRWWHARRQQVTLLALALLSLSVSAVFLCMSLVYNQGYLFPPLDDVYIHLQYGKQIGEGHFLAYNTGDPVSTGASSLLYALLLGLAWAVGFHGTWLLVFAVVWGSLCFAGTTVLIYLLGCELAGRAAGVWAGVLVAVCGPVAWGATSGMEVGFAAVLFTGTVYAFVREQPWHRFVWTPLLGALAALVRPEGWILVSWFAAAMVTTTVLGARRRTVTRKVAVRGVLLAVIPFVAGLAQLLLNLLATGSTTANGAQSKSLLYAGTFWPTEFLDETSGNLRKLLSLLVGLLNQDFAFPGALMLAALGVAGLALRPQWRILAATLGLGLLCVLAMISTLQTALWQNARYLQPFLPLFLLLVTLGAHALAEAAREVRTRRLLLHGPLSLALVFSLAVLPTWGVRLGEEAATIRNGPVSVAHWLRGHVPAGQSIGVNDVGATAYLSGHRIVDVMGLTTNHLATATNNGPGSLYEALRHMPAGQRPGYFSLYDAWPGAPVSQLGNGGVFGPALISFRLVTPARPEPGLPAPCESDHSCPQVTVHQANWSLAGSGDRMRKPLPGKQRDYLNVGYLGSEARHSYQVDNAQIGLLPQTMLRTVRYNGGRQVADSGRHIIGGESFTLGHLVPGHTMTVGARTDTTDAHVRRLAVSVDGRQAGVWTLSANRRGWRESTFRVPGNMITSGSARIQLAPIDPMLAPTPDYTSFGYWASQ